ncbi:uncharacterized protein SPSK_09258 [Sporothrix schenckii 1099-18]|uniref:Uncharacterized protein n=1 Tax=Sporothrix schenckii 1099-18 TaxID=1397361 RepID=A0A0F2M4I7_SPOSC|nr:uncharacterized protein SPSK_09258 [Sporothrix schenckii 1099-18]KJR84532.1 hypothetical protein SPSK_09258 [Sporothrix schenckii 1099-18]
MVAQMKTLLAVAATLLSLTTGALADCSSYGVDYANGGAYYIDGSSNQYFSFITIFQGCSKESISPILVDTDNNQYACSAISTTPAGTQQTSTCGIPFSAMKSGTWKIIVSGDQIAVQRTITLTVGVPQTSTVIATPTIVLGITTTPRAKTIVNTVGQTQTLILVPQTVTANCNNNNGVTQTITNYPAGRTQTVTTTITRTATNGVTTSQYQTTVTTAASCHYPSNKRDVNSMQSVMATTVTITETTRTVTQTRVSTAPVPTTTEVVFRTITATITPSPSTVCANGGNGRPGAVVTVTRGGNGGVATQTDIVYQTTRVPGTVWVGTISNGPSATACWRAGGWYGA